MRRAAFARRQDSEGVDQAKMVESAIGDTGVMRVTEQVIHPIHTEGIADNDLGENRLPSGEREILRLARADRELDHVQRSKRRGHSVPDAFHFLGQHDLSRQPLVVPAIGEEFFFRRVRERKVPHVVTERPCAGLAASIEVGLAGTTRPRRSESRASRRLGCRPTSKTRPPVPSRRGNARISVRGRRVK